jgi:outer membrane protein assembly factor BamB
MDGFEIVLGAQRVVTEQRASVHKAEGAPRLRLASSDAPRGRAAARPGPAKAREALDIFVGGVNVTARVDADQAPCVLRDLALAVVDLACGVRRRAVVRFYEAAWELGLERLDPSALRPEIAISVVRNGADAEVAVHDRRVALEDVIRGTRAAIAGLLERMDQGRDGRAGILASELCSARDALDRLIEAEPPPSQRAAEDVVAVVEPEAGLRCALGGELPLRVEALAADGDSSVETSDVHALLGRGRMRVVVRGRTKELGEVHTFLVAERLVELGGKLLDAWERGRALHARVDVGGPLVGVRLEAEGALSLTFVSFDAERSSSVFPSLEGPDLVDAVVSFGRALVRAVVRRDRNQASNLRLQALRRRVRELSDRLRDVARPVGPFGEADLVNARRESYRAYLQIGEAKRPAFDPKSQSGSSSPGSLGDNPRRLRYEPRWTAEVPGIDLRATFLCGDRLILSGASQTACVDRVDGRTLWKVPTVRATSLPTAGGLARLRGDGKLELRDFGDGSAVWSQSCAPRSRGTPAACTVSAPGLPRLLVATDGDRHLVAFDMASGEPRWRHALARPGPIRMRRAGRLLVISSDEAQLVALDVIDGRVVWRVRDRLRFSAPAAIEREDLIAIAGEPGGLARLHSLDTLSGARRYERTLDASVATDIAPLIVGTTCVVITRDRRGLGLLAIDRPSGVERWRAVSGAWPTGTSALGLEHVAHPGGLVVLNLPTGEVVALSAQTGETVWRHVFESPFQGDAPRRLEPILRSGALFVPQDKVRVLRPIDGAIVGVVGPSDLVPDLLRVDERCDVYIAEESGHVAAFGASAKLELIGGASQGAGPRGRLALVKPQP